MQTAIASTVPRAAPSGRLRTFLALAVGSTGVVYGDIGTSPLYAFKESIAHLVRPNGAVAAADVVGVVSLMFWSLMIVVTLKYVLVLMRFDNRGEGGTLSLMALVQKAGGPGARLVLLVGMLGAGLFFGDAVLTPAVSVLSAIEGLKVIDAVGPHIDPFIVPLTIAVLVGLFLAQKHGTGGVGRWFGPICIVWFLALAALGLGAIGSAPQILAAFDPRHGLEIFLRHPGLSPLILGSVFLTLTGAEALYADMGHFGRKPIQGAWLALVFPCLTLNYLGQGALVLSQPGATANPFFLLAPEALQLPLVLLATAATVIASQAVISGAFSMAQQAVQLGLLPRLTLKPTSEHHEGQVYAPEINWILLAGVVGLVLAFRSSSALASAYGISVVGAMITSSILAMVALRRVKGWPWAGAIAAFLPFTLVEAGFMGSNLLKVAHGGYVPLLIAAVLIVIMLSWLRGSRRLRAAEQSVFGVADLVDMLKARPPLRARGTAVFLTAEEGAVPTALLHNLKHNQVLHEQVVLLNVRNVRRPRLIDSERVSVTPVGPGLWTMSVAYGFMETPNLAHALTLARAAGLKFDIMRTSFFLSRRTVLPRREAGLARLSDLLFLVLMRNAARAADYFRIPPSRVVELGAQVTL